jgi:ABC-type multidrug transport system fused ATPase/permease subunit
MKDFLRFVWSLMRPHRRVLWLGAFLAVVAAVLDTAAPVIMGRVLDAAGQKAPVAAILAVVGLWAALRLVADVTRAYLGLRGDFMAVDAGLKYFREHIAMILDKPLSFHHGAKLNKLTDQIGHLRWDLHGLIVSGPLDLVPCLLTVLVIVGYVATLDWRISVSLLVTMAAYVGVTVWRSGEFSRRHEAWRDADSEVSGMAWDAVHNALVVKSSTNEELVSERLFTGTNAVDSANRHVGWYDFGTTTLQTVITTAAGLVTLALGADAVAAGRLTQGQLVALIAYSLTLFGYVRWTQWQFRTFLRAYVNWKQVTEGLAEPGEDFTSGEPVAVEGAVEFEHVRFRYRDERPILEDVSFRASAGMSVAVVGESGEGKTTIIELLGRYLVPQAGRVLIDGRDVSGINLHSLRSQMAYVPQDISLFNDTLAFNLRYGRMDATDDDIREAVRLAGLEPFVASLPDGLETKVGERGLKLSGGERQRVALARAFLRDPRLLVLDEPTSQLDSKTELVIHESLHRLMAGRTTFVVAHRLRTVAESDVILVLKDGRIAESGTHAELSAIPGGAYRALLDAQGLR